MGSSMLRCCVRCRREAAALAASVVPPRSRQHVRNRCAAADALTAAARSPPPTSRHQARADTSAVIAPPSSPAPAVSTLATTAPLPTLLHRLACRRRVAITSPLPRARRRQCRTANDVAPPGSAARENRGRRPRAASARGTL